ncbi:MAG: hypothetical protein KAS32_03860 [Candidatus Peribacteraceae bacterium]|nr:hypothetical protein [Candidatus Peribacteraceae bacterium]
MPQLMKTPESVKTILHYPNLKTVLLVEETIKELGATTKTNLFRTLNNRVNWQVMEVILDYLYARGMIVYDKIGKITWVYNPEGVRKWKKMKHLEVRV